MCKHSFVDVNNDGASVCRFCGEPETTETDRAVILLDPSTSFWLKDALETSKRRDLVDALHDAEMLAEILKKELEQSTS